MAASEFSWVLGRKSTPGPPRSPGLPRDINLQQKSAPETNSKAVSWPFRILGTWRQSVGGCQRGVSRGQALRFCSHSVCQREREAAKSDWLRYHYRRLAVLSGFFCAPIVASRQSQHAAERATANEASTDLGLPSGLPSLWSTVSLCAVQMSTISFNRYLQS